MKDHTIKTRVEVPEQDAQKWDNFFNWIFVQHDKAVDLSPEEEYLALNQEQHAELIY